MSSEKAVRYAGQLLPTFAVKAAPGLKVVFYPNREKAPNKLAFGVIVDADRLGCIVLNRENDQTAHYSYDDVLADLEEPDSQHAEVDAPAQTQPSPARADADADSATDPDDVMVTFLNNDKTGLWPAVYTAKGELREQLLKLRKASDSPNGVQLGVLDLG